MMIIEEIVSKLLEQLPTLKKKALDNEEKMIGKISNTTKELNNAKDEIQKLKQKLKDNNLEIRLSDLIFQ